MKWKKAAKMALKYLKKVAEKYNKLLLIKHLTQSVFPLRGFVRLRGFSYSFILVLPSARNRSKIYFKIL